MAQFTVFRNVNARSKATFPLLVDVQSDLLDELQTRVVIPLSKIAALTKRPVSQLTPLLQFEGVSYVLVTPQLAGVATNELGPATGSLADQRTAILAALDFLLLGF
ncbi:MAG TPA: CcdB family protein [Steroidobacteraceae bacterium]|nr:CcdB family protein [Steroidobacteraceae bacterium]